MNAESLYWSLMNRDDLRQVSGLTFEQAKFIVGLLAPEEHENWLAWHEGLTEWKPLIKLKQLTQSGEGPRIAHPPLPPPLDGEGDALAEIEEPVVDRRLNRRFLKEFKVKILGVSGGVFSTETLNVSSSGMLLRDPVPDAVGKSFSCELTREDGSKMKLFCSVVKDAHEAKGTRIKFLDVSQPKVLLAWLIDAKTR